MLSWRRRDPDAHVIKVPAMGQFRVVTRIVPGDGATTSAVQHLQVINDWHGPTTSNVRCKASSQHQFSSQSVGDLLDSEKTWRLECKLQGDVDGVEHSACLDPATVPHGTVKVTVHVETRPGAKRKYHPNSVTMNW